MKRKIIISIVILAVLVTGGYLFLRYSALKSESYKPDLSKANSALDLRPALIAKLQQLVKDGSSGLYNLQIGRIEPSVLNSTIDVFDVVLIHDPSALARLDSMQMLPDDVFRISFKSLHVSGIGIQDFLSGKDINLHSIVLDKPDIEVYHKERFYNAGKRLRNDTFTLYKKITQQVSSIAVKQLAIKNATVINHDAGKKKRNKFNDVSLQLDDLRIDSTTQFDKSRFLFAKDATISLGRYSLRTADSLYFLNCGSINISATGRQLTALNIEMIPRLSKEQFKLKMKVRTDMYTIKIPRLVLTGIDWWKAANNEELIATKADVYDCSFYDYLDRSMPPKKFKLNNFPHQAIMDIKLPLFISKVNLHGMKLTYEEFNPISSKPGIVYFDRITGEMTNITNIPAKVKMNNYMTFKSNALFMKSVPVAIGFKFNLADAGKGSFSSDVTMGKMDSTILNPLAEPLGLVNLKSGNIKEATAHLYGDNLKVHADFTMLYDNLYVIPLKKHDDPEDGLQKKKLTGLLANLLVIKDSNPGKEKKPRSFKYVVQRESHPNFFNQLWKTILMGIIKTIGAPEKLAK